MKLIIATLIICFYTTVEACEISKTSTMNIAISTRDKAYFSYVADQTLLKMPYMRATNCSEASMSGKFLMVAFGPEVLEYEDSYKGLNFNGEYKESRCQLKDTPFETLHTHEKKLQIFNDRWKFIKSCVEVFVEDEGPQPLSAPANQPGCQLTRYGKNKGIFNGGFCYFKPNFGSSFLVQLYIKDQCLTKAGLTSLGIQSFDINAGLNFYLSGDATGSSQNLKALSNTAVRLTMNPEPNLVRPSDDFGILYPTFPVEWKIPDIHLGELKLTELYDGRAKIEHSFLVDNNCPQKCETTLCQGHCDYAQPIVADISLYKIHRDKKKELITTWYEGGVSPAYFQGFVRGIGFEIGTDFLSQGDEFQIIASFTDPKFDFERFKKRVMNRLNTIDQQLGRIGRSNIPNVQEIPSINTGQDFPVLQPIPNVVFDRPLDSVAQAVATLRSYFSFKLWPPYYEAACGEKECISIQDDILTIETTFKLGALDQESKEYKLDIIDVQRRSRLLPDYSSRQYKKPYTDCSFQ